MNIEAVGRDDFQCLQLCHALGCGIGSVHPRSTQEMFSRGSAFSLRIRPAHCTHVPYGVWFERCTPHMVQGRSRSWKGCASNAVGRPLVRPRSWPDQHVHRRPPPPTCLVRKSSETSSFGPCYYFWTAAGSRSLGSRGRDPKGGQADRVRVRNRLNKPYGHRQNPSQNRRSF